MALCPDLSDVVQDDEGGRGKRTQPGVLTLGAMLQGVCPHQALRSRRRPRIRPRGEMEYWSVGVLRQVRIAPLGRGVGGAERATRSGGYR